MNQNQNEFPTGPFYPAGISIFFRSVAGIGGGVIGSILISLVFFIFSTIGGVNFVTSAEGPAHPLFIFVLTIITLIGTISANIMSAIFISYAEPQKYKKIASVLTQVFIINMSLFLFMTPIYVLGYVIDINYLKIVVASHAIISVMASNLVLEIISDYRYSLLEIYSTITATVFGILISIIFYFLNQTTLIFVAMPTFWFCIGFFGGIVRMAYYTIYLNYGIDALSVNSGYSNYKDSEKFFAENSEKTEEEELQEIFEEQ